MDLGEIDAGIDGRIDPPRAHETSIRTDQRLTTTLGTRSVAYRPSYLLHEDLYARIVDARFYEGSAVYTRPS